MGWQVQEGQEFEQAERGVYKARFIALGEELYYSEFYPTPSAMLKFEIEGGDNAPAMFATAKHDLAHVIYLLSDRKEQAPPEVVGNPQQLFAWANMKLQAVNWEGLVRVNYKGNVDQLQVPVGNYNGKFGGIVSRKRGTETPGYYEVEYKEKKSKKIQYRLVVTDGPFTSYTQTEALSFSYNYTDGQFGVNQRSALYALMDAAGYDDETAAEYLHLSPGDDPTLQIHEGAIQMARLGHRINFTVGKDGHVDWHTLTGLGQVAEPESNVIQQSPESAGAGTDAAFNEYLKNLLDGFSQEVLGGPFFDPEKGTPTRHAAFIGKNVLRVMQEDFPQLGIRAIWPPENPKNPWGENGVENATDLFEALSNEPNAKEIMEHQMRSWYGEHALDRGDDETPFAEEVEW
jgi:hypothetical protein